ncbi:hypothetical protein NR996_01620 [Lactobacillus rodentium]|uniref:Uncharacterized protein n=1 Tax=Lactobacillus rodentium TaxID=947835 RepID=A0A2Z6TNT9_9LACO|nr:hypothetical protein [Lactobacillus rodentium]MCR1894110.1 hypothetical protein [Lactobacillus rodentium]GBG04407.1 hypothetical protein LrDSM24759_03210 [Lactobacillus rodentium]
MKASETKKIQVNVNRKIVSMRIKEAAKKLPTQKIETDKEIADFFDEN